MFGALFLFKPINTIKASVGNRTLGFLLYSNICRPLGIATSTRATSNQNFFPGSPMSKSGETKRFVFQCFLFRTCFVVLALPFHMGASEALKRTTSHAVPRQLVRPSRCYKYHNVFTSFSSIGSSSWSHGKQLAISHAYWASSRNVISNQPPITYQHMTLSPAPVARSWQYFGAIPVPPSNEHLFSGCIFDVVLLFRSIFKCRWATGQCDSYISVTISGHLALRLPHLPQGKQNYVLRVSIVPFR